MSLMQITTTVFFKVQGVSKIKHHDYSSRKLLISGQILDFRGSICVQTTAQLNEFKKADDNNINLYSKGITG